MLVLLFLLVLRGADSEDDLSKYVFVLSFEKYAPKLQKFYEIKSRQAKKVKKRGEKSHFKGQYGMKISKLATEICSTLINSSQA